MAIFECVDWLKAITSRPEDAYIDLVSQKRIIQEFSQTTSLQLTSVFARRLVACDPLPRKNWLSVSAKIRSGITLFLITLANIILSAAPVVGEISQLLQSFTPDMTSKLLYNIGLALHDLGDINLTLACLTGARNVIHPVDAPVEKNPEIILRHSHLGHVTVAISIAYYHKGNYNKSIYFVKNAIGIIRTLEPCKPEVEITQLKIAAWLVLGHSYIAKNNYDHGIQYLNRADATLSQTPALRFEVCSVKYALGMAILNRSIAAPLAALRPLEDAMRIIELILEENDPEGPQYGEYLNISATIRTALGQVMALCGRLDGAIKHLWKAAEIKNSLLPSDHFEVAIVKLEIGLVFERLGMAATTIEHRRGKIAAAKHHVEHAHETLLAKLGPSHPFTIASGRHVQRLQLL